MPKATHLEKNSSTNLFHILNTLRPSEVDHISILELQVILTQALSEVTASGNQKVFLSGLCKHISKLFSANSNEESIIALFLLQFLYNEGMITDIELEAGTWINLLLNRIERSCTGFLLNQLCSVLLVVRANSNIQKQLNSTWIPKLFSLISKYLSVYSNEIVMEIDLE
jgi:hypothetical protein